MNKIAGLVVIALVALSIGVAAYAFELFASEPEVTPSISNLMGGSHNTPEEYVLNTTLPTVPEKLMVYKVVTNVTEAEVASLAEQFGLTGDIRDVEGMFLVTDGHHDLDVLNISGRVGYKNTSKSPEWVVESEKDRPEGVPSDEEAVEIATKFLNDKGLMPEDAVLRKVVPRMPLIFIPSNRSDSGEKEILTLWKGVEVCFGREINGYPVRGATMSVEIDGYGNVKDLYKLWRECELYKEYSIITPGEALEEFKRKGVDVHQRNVSTATINNVYLAYYSKCAGEKQTYLKPVYVFEGEAKGERGDYTETRHFNQYISAVSEDYRSTPIKYMLNTTLPSVPDEVMIYKTVRTDLSRPEVASLAERLGITGDVDGYFGKFGIGDSSNHSYLQVSNSSNHVMYTANTTRWGRGSDKDKPENLPSDNEAVEIAREFLNEKGLMPEDAVFRGTEHQALKAAVGFEHLVVSFGRELNGLPIVGDGSKISVEIGGYGDILKLLKVWREYEPYEEFSVIKPEEAIEKLKKGGISTEIRVDAVTINDIYLGYYAAPGSTKQTYLKPVYIFEGEARGRIDYHNESRHFVQHIAALQSFEE